MITKPIATVWVFKSSSGSGSYQTLQYEDGSTSCECPGWTRRAIRQCKHTRYVDCGMADSCCVTVKRYRKVRAEVITTQDPEPMLAGSSARRFDFES